jgi:flavin reductase (DIM6/NTAB) family NADH-FMN oxidoreductase RutF
LDLIKIRILRGRVNIEATGEFVIHVLREGIAEPMNQTAGDIQAR